MRFIEVAAVRADVSRAHQPVGCQLALDGQVPVVHHRRLILPVGSYVIARTGARESRILWARGMAPGTDYHAAAS